MSPRAPNIDINLALSVGQALSSAPPTHKQQRRGGIISIFVRMRQCLESVREYSGQMLHPLIRAAAHSSLLAYNKYMGLFTELEVYWIAVDRKIQWLRGNSCSESDIAQVFSIVTTRFNSFNPTPPTLDTPKTTKEISEDLDNEVTVMTVYWIYGVDRQSWDEWLFKEKLSATSELWLGSIESYLRTEPVSGEVIRLAGRPLRYWEAQATFSVYSRLAKFTIDYLSAPGKYIFNVIYERAP
ncbi:unnamed protein product [Rhizoctonia solani]|uniref:Uncharacterized protein n=1 Tax=Rhizoctonia solani TaxID=456999 RepID=A0A8H3B111_9AGAM|nr:unnamed protein product [Rhizoctonia solani]